METRIYQIMKSRHGEKFPIHRNGRPIITKWIIRAIEQIEEKEEISLYSNYRLGKDD